MTILMDPTAAAEITGLADLSLVAPVMTTVRYLGGAGIFECTLASGLASHDLRLQHSCQCGMAYLRVMVVA